MTDKYAVIGNPIGHSKSPVIHAAFARQTGQDIEYGRILGNTDTLAEEIKHFFVSGGKGLNVTLPFKEAAWRMMEECSERASQAGAVNTIIPLSANRLRGENTDGAGLIRDLEINHGARLAGARILLLGAGGASRGVAGPLLDSRPSILTIANRTPAKALELASRLSEPVAVRGCGLNELQGLQFDIIINGTSAGLDGKMPDIPDGILASDGWCYDMLYANQPTVFVRWGMSQGAARSLDGLGMLVEQAAESFFLWRGVRPDTTAVISSLRS